MSACTRVRACMRVCVGEVWCVDVWVVDVCMCVCAHTRTRVRMCACAPGVWE